MKKALTILIILIIFSLNSNSFSEELDNWEYYKEISHDNTNEYKSVFLDEEVYKYAKQDLSDIRIISDENQVVPYYILNMYLRKDEYTVVQYQSNEILSYMEENDNYTDFKVIVEEANTDVLVNKLILDINKSDFLKEMKVYGSYDSIKWDYIKNDHIYRTDSGEKLSVNLDNTYKYDFYRVVFVNDVENTPIADLKLIYDRQEIEYSKYNSSKLIDYKIKNTEDDTIITLNNENHLKINEIKVNSNDDFKRDYQIYYKDHNLESIYLTSGEIFQIQLEKFKIKNNIIKLDKITNSYLSGDTINILIKNKDDRPISIDSIEVSYYVDKLVFKQDGSNQYRIVYGNVNSKRPIYDIENYKEYIENEDQEKCRLSKIHIRDIKNTEEEPNRINYKLILNITVFLICILLVIVIIRKSNFKDL